MLELDFRAVKFLFFPRRDYIYIYIYISTVNDEQHAHTLTKITVAYWIIIITPHILLPITTIIIIPHIIQRLL